MTANAVVTSASAPRTGTVLKHHRLVGKVFDVDLAVGYVVRSQVPSHVDHLQIGTADKDFAHPDIRHVPGDRTRVQRTAVGVAQITVADEVVDLSAVAHCELVELVLEDDLV